MKLNNLGKVVANLYCLQNESKFKINSNIDNTIESIVDDGFIMKKGVYCLVINVTTSSNKNERTLILFSNPGSPTYESEYEIVDTGAESPYMQHIQSNYSATLFVGGGKVFLKKVKSQVPP